MTTATPKVTETLAEHTLAFPGNDIPDNAREAARKLLLDFLAVAVGGRQFADSTATVLAGTHDLLCGAEGNCTVAGEATGYPAHFAALLNGTFAHSMDFDDTHVDSVIHIGSPLFSTLLAIGERERVSGRAFLDAAVLGYDFIAKAGNVHGAAVHKRGFHPTPTTGIFGAVAAGARLLGLSGEQTLNALGIALNQAAGTMAFLEGGAWTKRLQVGLAAHNAIYALTYARQGLSGPEQGTGRTPRLLRAVHRGRLRPQPSPEGTGQRIRGHPHRGEALSLVPIQPQPDRRSAGPSRRRKGAGERH